MRSWMISLAGSLLFGFASAALADQDPASSEPAAEAAASAPEETPAEEPVAPEEAEAAAPEPAAEESEEAAAEEPEGSFISRYGNDVRNTFLAGVNGVITWPADPVMLAMKPTDEMRSMPGGVVTGPVTGFFAGTLLGVYRLVDGHPGHRALPAELLPDVQPRAPLSGDPGLGARELAPQAKRAASRRRAKFIRLAEAGEARPSRAAGEARSHSDSKCARRAARSATRARRAKASSRSARGASPGVAIHTSRPTWRAEGGDAIAARSATAGAICA